jgi:hypothetical protein
MRKIVFALGMFAISATAADFRAVDFGQYCSTIPEWEASQGSSPTPWPKPHAASYAFRVQQFDRIITATYVCADGKLIQGNYFFPVESWSQTTDSYRATYEALRDIYGDTIAESLPWRRKEDSEPPAITHPRVYMTSWRTPKVSVTMYIVPNEQWEPVGWRVFVMEFKTR